MRPTFCRTTTPQRSRGLSLVELMISVTIGLFILAGMVSIFASSSQSQKELEKASRQIENGRFSVEMLREDIQLAGFYGDYVPISSTTWTTPDPCTTIQDNMGLSAATTPPNVPTGIFGYESAATLTATCASVLANRRSGTDVLVIRRANTGSIVIDADENNSVDADAAITTGGYYLQVSNCADSPAEAAFVLGKTPATFVLHKVKPVGTPATCKSGGLNAVRGYIVHIYYVANCNNCSGSGDGIPTLKMAELVAGTAACASSTATACGSFRLLPIAEGVENMQLEYGADSNGDGTADSYELASAIADWSSVVSVKAFILARNTETTPGYTDSKVYALNSNGDTTGLTATGDQYKRHVFTVTARANNIAGRRQQ